MVRDNRVGAVCSRTFPLGSGPVYWYQIFDYAIGHWLQKASNHILGSVLCCPGCFSVYRVEALRDVLATYASHVEKASEFLTKDMGEDRWLCTLMVESGWRLEYCAAASNSTYCPEDFDEFFKQRRRWIPSTLANQVLLLQGWRRVLHFNKRISLLFIIYQALLLFSTLINPSVSILIIVGGLYYAWNFNQIVISILLIFVTIAYTIVCLRCSQEAQLMGAKILTGVCALVMTAVIIGTAVQIVEENTPDSAPSLTTTLRPLNETFVDLPTLYSTTTTHHPQPHKGPDRVQLPISVTTAYLSGLVGIFILTAILHLPEAYCLLNGVWYLMCLPAGNLVLMIYSICNMTDRSWGTREEKKMTDFPKFESWTEYIYESLKNVFFCCRPRDNKLEVIQVTKAVQTDVNVSGESDSDSESLNGAPSQKNVTSPKSPTKSPKTKCTKPDLREAFQFGNALLSTQPIPARCWLPTNLRDLYTDNFEIHGFDNTSFISGITDNDLKDIGIGSKAHRSAICEAIKFIPEPEIEPCVPDNIDAWLDCVGLSMYTFNFHKSHIVSASNMEVLKTMSRDDIKAELEITKNGHLKRLLLAISKLRYPTPTEKAAVNTKYELEALDEHNLRDVSISEFEFWEKLRQERLLPDSAAFAHDLDLKVKLEELRNTTLVVFGVSNTIWLMLIMTLITKTELNVLDTNALGLSFLVIFGIIIVIQFFCMIFHRVTTWMHMLSRAPSKCGAPYNASWTFGDSNPSHPPRTVDIDDEDIEAAREVHRLNRQVAQTYIRRSPRRDAAQINCCDEQRQDERRPLLKPEQTSSSQTNYQAIPV